MAALRVAMSAGLVLANGDGRFNTGTRPTSICAAKLRSPASYSRTMRKSASLDLVTVARLLDPSTLQRKVVEEAMSGG
jgi:hypothetical protein